MSEGTVPVVYLVAITAVLFAVLLWFWPRSAAADLLPGQAAPDFSLLDQNGERQTLAGFHGQWLVLYFYPKDDTPGCTTEACQFRDDYYKLRALKTAVVGVSLDDVGSHKAFAEKYHLPFPLLADREHKVAEAYGVLTRLGPLRFASRQTFIIDPEGRIARHFSRVKPKQHPAEVIKSIESLAKSRN
ncbi:MAG: peroxiredoxin [Granulosicoccaceae bacterium]|jgi:peroxiredoxin Q/BCP